MLRLYLRTQLRVRVVGVGGVGGEGRGEGMNINSEIATSPGLFQRSVSFIFAFQWNYGNGGFLCTFFAHWRTLLFF